MITLCKIFNVPDQCFNQDQSLKSIREVDFYLIRDEKNYRCEVKLMGKGNPESADAIFARESNIFIADKLSDLNKQQAEKLDVHWVELRNENGYKRFEKILTKFNLPHQKFEGDLDKRLDQILAEIVKNKK